MDENNERHSRKRKPDVANKKKPQASNQRLPLSETVAAPSNTRVSLAELLSYDPLTGTLPTSHLSNTSSTQQQKLKGSFAQTKRRPRNVLPLADVTNYFPQSLNAVSNFANSSRDSSSAFCEGTNLPFHQRNSNIQPNFPTISSGRVSIMPQQPITYATSSSDIGVILSPNSGNSMVSQRSVLCNTINNGNLGTFSPNYLPTSCNKPASVPATRPVSITPQHPKNVSTTPSDMCDRAMTSGGSILTQTRLPINIVNNVQRSSVTRTTVVPDTTQSTPDRATRHRQSPMNLSNVSFQTPECHKVNQHTNNTSTSGVQRIIPSIITQNSSYEVGESSRRTKRSKRPSLQAPTPVSNSTSSSGPSNSKNPIDRNIINEVRAVLDTSSELVQTFRRARDRFTEDIEQNIKIKLIAKRGKDGRNYNLPTANEVAGLIVGDFDSCAEQRDIIIDKRAEGLQRINIFHPMYLPLQYPLLMPRAQDGYHLNIPLKKTGKKTATIQRTTDKKDKNDKTVTMRQWFSYHIMDRPNQENLFTHGGRLFQQFLVDGYTMIETERLYFHRSKQSKLRCDTYSNIRQSIASGNTDPTALGKPLLRSRGTTLRHWPEMPYPDDTYITDFGNRLIHEETDYNPVELQSEYERIKQRVHGESSSRGQEAQEEELDINVLLKWFEDERKKKAARKAKKLLAKDEKEFSRSKALVVHEEDEFSDVSLDGLDYEEAHLAFDKENSPKFHD
ncbi:hypothetical protein CTI12_AA246400 [Artemisia annua]|uniref:Helitron helicase-like domain-containing protein n=1 Tax=Artemisia annua TaxID=35608 RepID=A0A2U1NNF8_ARTAN|nr:hypothetical protein CTI12_AA246400 [Artemisia annua]